MEAKFKVDQEAEFATLQRELESKRRKLHHLDLCAAQASMQVFEEINIKEHDREDVVRRVKENRMPDLTNKPVRLGC